LWASFIGTGPNNDVLVCSTADGKNWSKNTNIPNQSSKFGPSLAVFKDHLYVAFIGNGPNNDVLLCSTADGKNWSKNTSIPNQSSQCGPSLAVFKDHLYVAFIGSGTANKVLVCSTADGKNWSDNTQVNIQAWSLFGPALAAFNNLLYVAFAYSSPYYLQVCSTADGKNWSDTTFTGQESLFAPALTVAPFGNTPPPPPPPQPKVWCTVQDSKHATVYGSGFSDNMCRVHVDREGFVGPFKFEGDITKGIPIKIECTGSKGQYWVVHVTSIGGGPTVTGHCNCGDVTP